MKQLLPSQWYVLRHCTYGQWRDWCFAKGFIPPSFMTWLKMVAVVNRWDND